MGRKDRRQPSPMGQTRRSEVFDFKVDMHNVYAIVQYSLATQNPVLWQYVWVGGYGGRLLNTSSHWEWKGKAFEHSEPLGGRIECWRLGSTGTSAAAAVAVLQGVLGGETLESSRLYESSVASRTRNQHAAILLVPVLHAGRDSADVKVISMATHTAESPNTGERISAGGGETEGARLKPKLGSLKDEGNDGGGELREDPRNPAKLTLWRNWWRATICGTWAWREEEGGKPGGGATVVAEGKASRFLSCPKEEIRLLLHDSVRLMERSGLKESGFGLETGPWLQMLDDQKGLPLSLLLTCSVLKLWLEEAGGEGVEKKEADRFSRLCPGPLS
ncbi:hypothetical protein FQN60_005058 [Etheostoma spectabile]|uniref:Uncharacterized protein n=1 Tax=Etheostoma spectabile TaxID=54343 RepID=A0A5J5DLI5_9PERO|nr:hypothetical protein FQN60_005058 [Etheostoma spectabile]